MKFFKKHKLLKIFGLVVFAILMMPIIVYTILYFFVLPPKKLTPIVVNLINENINARFECEEIELTFFSTYPHIGIRLTNGYLLSDVANDTVPDSYEYRGKDTLLAFNECRVMFKVLDYLGKKEITIGNIVLDNPHIYAYVNTQGLANWDIIKPSADTISAIDTINSPLPLINVERLHINGADLAYYDRVQHLYTALNDLTLDLKGDLTGGTNFVDIVAEWKKFRYYSRDYSLQNSFDMKIDTQLELSDKYKRFKLHKTNLLINKMPFSLIGEVHNNTERGNVEIDVEYELNVSNIESLLTFIPKKHIENYKLSAKGEVYMAGTIKGEMGNDSYPVIKSSCEIKNVSVSSSKIDYTINQMTLDMDMVLDIMNDKESYINLKKAFIKSQYFNLDIEAKLNNLFSNPVFDGKISSDIDFTKLSKTLLSADTFSIQGKFIADMQTRFTLNDILYSNYGKIQAVGEVDISDLKVQSIPYEIDANIGTAKVTMTSERSINQIADGSRLLNGKLYVDSLSLKYAEDVNTNLKNLYVSFSTPTIPDTTGIIPVAGRVSFDDARMRFPDSLWVRAGKTEIKGGLLPSSKDKKTPVITAIINSDSIIYFMRDIKSGALLTGSSFDIRFTPYVRLVNDRLRNAAGRDSTFRRLNAENGDSISMLRGSRSVDSTLILTGASSDLFSEWETTGKLGFKRMRLWSPYFPILIEMQGSNLQFTSNELNLSGARLILGESDFSLDGKITNMRRALLRGGRLNAELSTTSDYINCDELMNAIARGVNYGETKDLTNDNVQSLADVEELTQNIASNSIDDGLFVLPSYLNLSVHTKAKNVKYQHLELKNTNGQLVLNNQSAQLTNFYSQSNIGGGSLSLFYTARNKKEASMGFDINMTNILVDKLIDLIPSVDTLLPMLRSFEGVVDCQMVATCMLDSTSSIILPDMQAACYLRGKNMVLLDGETFAEISKKLMFKNKKRNMIDSIAVDLTVNQSDIEIYPFLVELDRYRLAVGGIHNLDMSFNYHISVLKSPVPFKLGIDVTGTVDDFKYKITKCRYKEMFKSAKTGTIDTTRLNVRRNIYNGIQENIKSNLNNTYRPRRFVVQSPVDTVKFAYHNKQPIVGREEESDTLNVQ